MEASPEVSQKTKNVTIIQGKYATPCHTPKGLYILLHKYLHIKVYCYSIKNS